MKLSVLLFCFFFLLSAAAAPQAGPTSRNVLVLLSDNNYRETHSLFFNSLKDKGQKLTFGLANDPDVKFEKYGQFLYDSVILVVSETADINVDGLLNFIDSGKNVFIATDSLVPERVRELARENGVEFDDTQNMVIDHLNYDTSDTDYHTLITTKEWRQVPIMTGQPKAPVLYRGIGFTLSDKNSLVLPLLTGSSSSFSYSPEQQVEDDSHAALGKNTVLVAALQARNNARVTICGSIEALSNAFFEAPVATASQKFDKSGNEEYFTNLVLWTVQERGVVSLSNPRHELVEQVSTPITSNGTYRIGDIIEFNVQLSEWKDGKWVPFQSEEVQFEFVRLDPYVRLPVKGKQGLFTLRFRLPDIYGVFTMKLVHHKTGYSYLTWSDLVSVRPYRHNEYERFIPMAFPYYASVFSMMGGFFVFTFLILYGKK